MPKPIIFSPWSVERILAGAKTRTSRLLQLQPSPDDGFVPMLREEESGRCWANVDGRQVKARWAEGEDVLIREQWRPLKYESDRLLVEWKDGSKRWVEMDKDKVRGIGQGWKSPLHMPNAVCRLRVTVTDVRLLRVGMMPLEMILEEGISVPLGTKPQPMEKQIRKEWEKLWDEMHAPWKAVRASRSTGDPRPGQERVAVYESFPMSMKAAPEEKRSRARFVVHPNPWVWTFKFEKTWEAPLLRSTVPGVVVRG